jgi:LEA14-like dessication related protein
MIRPLGMTPRFSVAFFQRLAAVLAATLVLLGAGGCSFLRTLTGIGLQRPTLAYESWSADQLDLEGVTIALHYRLENPSDFSLDLRRLDYRLEVEGRQVAEGDLPTGVQLRAQGATPLVFPIRLRWRDLPGFVELLLSRSDLGYRVTGSAGVGSPIGILSIPFEHRDRVALPRPPSLRLEGITLREASLSSLALELRLRIENGNGFPLPVGALVYGLRLGARDLLSGGTQPLVAVAPGGHAVVSVPVRLSLKGATDALAELLRGAALRLHGSADFGALEVPVDTQGHLSDR